MPIPNHVNHFQHPNQTRNLRNPSQIVYPGVNVSSQDGISDQNSFANKNKWICDIPIFLVLGPDYSNVTLRLSTFTIPAIDMGTDKVMYRGVEIERPTHTMQPGSKEITFNYYIKSDWTDYRALYNWCMNNAPINKGANALDTGNVNANGLLRTCDIDVTLLSPYKKRIVGFRFKNCWIKSFSDLQLAYDGADELQHSFTVTYTNFVILDLNGLESQIKSPVAKDAREQAIADSKRRASEEFLSRYGNSHQFQTYGDSQGNTFGSSSR